MVLLPAPRPASIIEAVEELPETAVNVQEPRVTVPRLKVTVPVGAMFPLGSETVAVKVKGLLENGKVGLMETPIVVGQELIPTSTVFDVYEPSVTEKVIGVDVVDTLPGNATAISLASKFVGANCEPFTFTTAELLKSEP